jgi:sirohydrochlorin cobaltochelatase
MLILVAHGSRNPRWCASVEKLIESLQADLGPSKVRLAYMEWAPPTLMDVALDAVRAGVQKIRVLPLFLTGQGHLFRDIHPLVDQLRKAHRSVEVTLLPPVGQHRLFRELLFKIAVEETA